MRRRRIPPIRVCADCGETFRSWSTAHGACARRVAVEVRAGDTFRATRKARESRGR